MKEAIHYSMTVSPDPQDAEVLVNNKKTLLSGHKITVNSQEFFVVPLGYHFIIFEMSSGRKLYQKHEGPEIQTYEQVMQCFEGYGIELAQLIHDKKLNGLLN